MTDITKCTGNSCPQKENCFRYKAKEGYYQSYFDGTPIEESGICEYYWAIDDKIDLLNKVWSD